MSHVKRPPPPFSHYEQLLPVRITHGLNLPRHGAHLLVVPAHTARIISQQRIVRKLPVVSRAVDQHGVHDLHFVQDGPVHPHDRRLPGAKLRTIKDISMVNVWPADQDVADNQRTKAAVVYLLSVGIQHFSDSKGETEGAESGSLSEGRRRGEL